ncbi:hypothetical protein [Aestuariirhabdus litorea]|uniref:RcnB family protein n=1 Tax=Aestuariirhabdus litorea TaxID=2528527 RepID=A0A3P3VLI2_9GAMM|nr:hypothetical protein [Aestuariirhabdus litorea]RRJ82738.1 hypothetical protein D0544_12845 [Aestuariirhabdus litorea]RWW92898.1 hypothetical protein DZC74_12820 [Endozoicomonadaceae bacterium GTF-13]
MKMGIKGWAVLGMAISLLTAPAIAKEEKKSKGYQQGYEERDRQEAEERYRKKGEKDRTRKDYDDDDRDDKKDKRKRYDDDEDRDDKKDKRKRYDDDDDRDDKKDKRKRYDDDESSSRGKSSHSQLPPGLQKKVARGEPLPPGWQKKLNVGGTLPADLYERGTVIKRDEDKGVSSVEIENTVVDVLDTTREIIGILNPQK